MRDRLRVLLDDLDVGLVLNDLMSWGNVLRVIKDYLRRVGVIVESDRLGVLRREVLRGVMVDHDNLISINIMNKR